MKASCEVIIHQPPERVFPWIIDPERARQWRPDVVAGVHLVETPKVVGTTSRETIGEDGLCLEMQGCITDDAVNERGSRLERRIHTVDVHYWLAAEAVSLKCLCEGAAG